MRNAGSDDVSAGTGRARAVCVGHSGILRTAVLCGAWGADSKTGDRRALSDDITGGRFFCDIADVTKEPSPCDIRARCRNGKRVYRDNAGTGDARGEGDGVGCVGRGAGDSQKEC